MQHLERHLPLEVQVAHAIHPAEAARAERLEELVVVAERAAEPLFPVLGVLAHRDLAGGHRRALVGAGVGREVLEHLGRREVPVVGRLAQRAQEDPVEGLRAWWGGAATAAPSCAGPSAVRGR